MCRQHGPMPSRVSPRPILMEATTLQLLPKQPVSSTAMDTQTCCSSQPRQLKPSFDPQPPMPCPTLLGTRRSRMDILRMLASPSTVERDGQTWFSTTTKFMSVAMLPLPWATTSSPALQMEARPKLSTLSATRRMLTARCASSSTTPQCHTACLQPLHLERLLKRK